MSSCPDIGLRQTIHVVNSIRYDLKNTSSHVLVSRGVKMGFSDLDYGWHTQQFILSDARLIRRTQLQDQDADGKWAQRNPDSKEDAPTAASKVRSRAWLTQALANEADASMQRRYESQKRTMVAKASIADDTYETIFLGVPENKQCASRVGESGPQCLRYLEFSIHEATPKEDNDRPAPRE